MRLAIIGGSGRIGARLVRILREQGHQPVPASRGSGVNTITGEGLAAALDGADVVVDVSAFRGDAAVVLNSFETSTTNLLPAEAAAGVTHHVALSIVGVHRLSEGGYFRAKIAQEKLIEASSIPYSIVRATQFFEFVTDIANAATVDTTVRCPQALIQPIAADDVAHMVADVATAAPLNGTLDVAGPRAFRFDELVRLSLSAHHDSRDVIADPDARYFGTALGERTLVPDDNARLGQTRFEDWLAASTDNPPHWKQ